MTTAYRLTKAKYAETAFSGEGARLHGGRWSPPGLAVVYLAESLPLAALEILVHLERPAVLRSYVYFQANCPDELVLTLDDEDLPEDWRSHPEPISTTSIGAAWVTEKASLLLRVPSTVVPGSYNFLLDPNHPEFERLEIDGPFDFEFDRRLV